MLRDCIAINHKEQPMRFPAILAALLIATPALAQTAPPEMVTIPRDVAQAAANQIHHPDPMNNVDVLVVLQSCMADNPVGGRLVRMGPDQCSSVTDALGARDKALSDAQATISTLTKDRDTTKASLAVAEKQISDDKAVAAAMEAELTTRDKTIADMKAGHAEVPADRAKKE